MNHTFHSVVCAPEGSTMVPLPNGTDKEPQESMKKANRQMEIKSHRPGLTFDPPPFFVTGRWRQRAEFYYGSEKVSPSFLLSLLVPRNTGGTSWSLHQSGTVTLASLGSFSPDSPALSAHSFTSFTSPWKPICSAVPLSLTRMDSIHFKHLHYSCIRKNTAAS